MSDLIKYEEPPNYAALCKRFGVGARDDVIFAYAPHIYAPRQDHVHPAIVAHELVHMDRQRRHPGGVAGWWAEYISNEEFRLLEEIPAHYAEFKWLEKAEPGRKSRRRNLAIVANKLASPLYGRLVTIEVAKSILQMGPDHARFVGDAEANEAQQDPEVTMGMAEIRGAFVEACPPGYDCHTAVMNYDRSSGKEMQVLTFTGIGPDGAFAITSEAVPPQGDLHAAARETAARLGVPPQ